MEPKSPYYVANRERVLAKVKAYQESRPTYTLWVLAKHRAKRWKVEFSIEPEDIVVPEVCPILGLKLERRGMKSRDTSPSLDRIDSSRGYTRDNIQVISNRANRIKAAGTPDELMKIAIFANRDHVFVPEDRTSAESVAAAQEASRVARDLPKEPPFKMNEAMAAFVKGLAPSAAAPTVVAEPQAVVAPSCSACEGPLTAGVGKLEGKWYCGDVSCGLHAREQRVRR